MPVDRCISHQRDDPHHDPRLSSHLRTLGALAGQVFTALALRASAIVSQTSFPFPMFPFLTLGLPGFRMIRRRTGRLLDLRTLNNPGEWTRDIE